MKTKAQITMVFDVIMEIDMETPTSFNDLFNDVEDKFRNDYIPPQCNDWNIKSVSVDSVEKAP